MDDEERDACLVKIKVTMAKMANDIGWVKKIVAVMILAIMAVFGLQLPPGLIE